MKRATVFPGSIPRSLDLLKTNQFAMVGLAKLSQDVFGSDTVATGLACTPTSPASLNVVIAPGNIYALANLEGTAYSSLPADTAHQILKQGALLDASTLACPAPTTSGQSINYLIQATFQEVDTDPLVLPYYNASIPAQPYSGPNNDGSANYTTREGTLILGVKAGISATSGSQTTPAPDSGYIGLWVVTVAFGATTIASGAIAAYSGSPLLSQSVLAIAETALANAVQALTSRAECVYYGGVPTGGTVTTFTRSFSFTAPGDGWVFAAQGCNPAQQQPGSVQNTVGVQGSVSGSFSLLDSTLFPMSNTVTKSVVSGETVTVSGSVQSDGTAGSWKNIGVTLSYIFIPRT